MYRGREAKCVLVATSSRVCVFSMLLKVRMQAPPMYFGPSFFAGGALSGRLSLLVLALVGVSYPDEEV